MVKTARSPEWPRSTSSRSCFLSSATKASASAQDCSAASHELIEKFGGVTAYTRSPAKGFWEDKGRLAKDDVIIVETMTTRREKAWWRRYRSELEERFKQEKIVIRVQRIEEV